MRKPLLIDTEVHAYIPQRPPMVMLDKLYLAQEKMTTTGLTIKADNILVRDDQFSSMGLIENMAQTAAIGAGYYFVENNLDIKIGFIGAIKNLIISDWPAIGDEIVTEVKEMHNVANIKVVEGTVRLNDRILATCELKIFLQDNP